MLTIILFVTIALFFSYLGCKRYRRERQAYQDDGSLGFYLILGPLVGAALGMTFAALIINPRLPRVSLVESRQVLASLRSNIDTGGTLVWGSGTVQGVRVYDVYLRVGAASVVPVRIRSGRVMIVEDATLKNEGIWTRIVSKNDRSSSLAPWSLFREDRTIDLDELRVPVGSVQHEFRAN